MEEDRERSKQYFIKHQQIVKTWFDNTSVPNKDLQVNDLVLKWDKDHEDKGDHTKFQHLWLGPFVISKKLGMSTL